MRGLSAEQLTELVARVHAVRGGGFTPAGRAYALGLFGSVALVVFLMRKNVIQEFAGAIFGVSQATVSRRWDLLRPLIAQVLAEFVPALGEVAGREPGWWTARSVPPGTGATSPICTRPRPDTQG
ncbi:MAG: transposase family protein [Pseudonocardiaceae bacterium]